MIHSGSRNFGYKVGTYYSNIAKSLCQKWYSNISNLSSEESGAFLPISTPEAKECMVALEYLAEFAKASRKLMLENTKRCILEVFGHVTFEKEIDVHHNYVRYEHHFGSDVLIHRKGAVSAREGEIGIIPGSQATPSYIVEGKGNPDSFMSCSHGAGRTMSRKQAKNTLDFEEEKRKLDEAGVIHSMRSAEELDEAPSAYKDIDVVMENQKDLVNILVKLEPLAVIKG